jgi:MFS family permease
VPKLIGGHDRSRVLAVAALIMGVGFGLVAFAGSAWFFALTVVIWTLGEMLQSPSNAAIVAALSPLALRGRYQGLDSLSWSLGTALAPVLGGLTQQHLGNGALWIGCFVVCTLVAAGHLAAGPTRERRMTRLANAEPTTPTLTATPPDTPATTNGVEPPALPRPPGVAKPVAETPIHFK